MLSVPALYRFLEVAGIHSPRIDSVSVRVIPDPPPSCPGTALEMAVDLAEIID